MSYDYSAYISDGVRGANWVATDLWIAAVGLSGTMDLGDVHRIMSGEREPTRHEYTVLVHALNERYQDLGLNHPTNYWEELPGSEHLTTPAMV